ncbi:MAG TPA: hypothetical protein VKB25_02160, partial [Conexibacter sp.]|nr:hypothetical protein [Conexibacter sp.]
VDDIRITARKGVLVVLGKGELRREVPLNALVRQVLEEWLAEHAKLVREGERALWVSRTGRRLERSAAGRCISIRAGRATATTCSVWPASASAAPRRCPPASTNCAWSSPTTAAAPPKGGGVTLHLDGEQVAEGRVYGTVPMIFSAAETADVGQDTGTTVSDDYSSEGSRFTGTIEWVQIDIDAAADDEDHLIGPRGTAADRDGAAIATAAVQPAP